MTGGLSWGSVPGSGVSVGMQSVLQDCEITGNRPSGWDWRNKGGGVYVNGGKVLRCVFHGNGVVDNIDSMLVARYTVNLIEKFPVER